MLVKGTKSNSRDGNAPMASIGVGAQLASQVSASNPPLYLTEKPLYSVNKSIVANCSDKIQKRDN